MIDPEGADPYGKAPFLYPVPDIRITQNLHDTDGPGRYGASHFLALRNTSFTFTHYPFETDCPNALHMLNDQKTFLFDSC